MARPVLGREERRRAPLFGSRARRTAAWGLWLAAMRGGGDVGPRMAIRTCGTYCRCGCEREGGVDVRCGQGPRPFRAVRDAAGVTVGHC
jgi:hypothetical protein